MPDLPINNPVMLPKEAIITINGKRLTDAQAMAMRVACTNFYGELVETGLGDDENGQKMTQAYTGRLKEIFKMWAANG